MKKTFQQSISVVAMMTTFMSALMVTACTGTLQPLITTKPTEPSKTAPKTTPSKTPTLVSQFDYGTLYQSSGAEVYDTLGEIQPYTKVLTTPEAYATETAKFDANIKKDIDFSKQQVVVATLGTKTNGGTNISLDSVYHANGKTKVVLVVNSSASNCMTTSVMTVPYVFVWVNSTKPIEVERVVKVHPC